MRSPKFPAERHRPDVASIDCSYRSLAARFAPGDDDTGSTECNRHIPLDERAPNVSLEFGLRFLKNFFPVHRSTIPSRAIFSPLKNRSVIAGLLGHILPLQHNRLEIGIDA